MNTFIPKGSIDPTVINEMNSWAKFGITDSNGCIRTIFDQNDNSISFVHFNELDQSTQQMILNKHSFGRTADSSSDSGFNSWVAASKDKTNFVPASQLGFGEMSTTLSPNSVHDFNRNEGTGFYGSSISDGMNKESIIGKVDNASFGTAKGSDNVEITRDYDLSRFGLPKSKGDNIDDGALGRYDQLEYGVEPQFKNLQSLMMPPVRLSAINKPRDLVTFTVTPSFSIIGSANYETYDLTHSPVDIATYRSSPSKTITLSGSFISRNTYEASINQQRLNILEAWTKPYFGIRTAKSMYGKYLGAPPSILKFYAYGQRCFNGVPVVLLDYRADWNNNCAIVYTEKGQPFPTIMPITVTIRESWSPDQIGNFNIEDLFAGNMVKAYTGKFKI